MLLVVAVGLAAKMIWQSVVLTTRTTLDPLAIAEPVAALLLATLMVCTVPSSSAWIRSSLQNLLLLQS